MDTPEFRLSCLCAALLLAVGIFCMELVAAIANRKVPRRVRGGLAALLLGLLMLIVGTFDWGMAQGLGAWAKRDWLPVCILGGIGLASFLPLLVAVAGARLRSAAPLRFRRLIDAVFLLPLFGLPASMLVGWAHEITLWTHWLVPPTPRMKTLPLPLDALREPTIEFLMGWLFLVPLLYLCVCMGFRKVKPEWLEAARMQGLGPCGRFWRIWVPTAKEWLLLALTINIWQTFACAFVALARQFSVISG